jgi:hypothetical protein
MASQMPQANARRLWRHPEFDALALGPGILHDHYQRNQQFLLQRPADGLLFPFRDAAGLHPEPASESCFGVGYGEFCGGWLMAASHICQMTGDSEMQRRLAALLDELVSCAQTTPAGYLPISRLTYPAYYTRGVMLHALRVSAAFTGRPDVQRVLEATTNHVVDSLKSLAADRARRVVRGEYPWWDEGNGLCESLALLGRADALDMVEGPSLLYPLARNIDILQGRHANAALMLIMGWPAAYELTNRPVYLSAFSNSWGMILERTYVTGGSCDEYGDGDWEAWPAANDVRFIAKTQETCTAFHWLRHNDVMLCYTGDALFGDMIVWACRSRGCRTPSLPASDRRSGEPAGLAETTPRGAVALRRAGPVHELFVDALFCRARKRAL